MDTIIIPVKARKRRLMLVRAMFLLNTCSRYLSPPKNILIPNTKSRLPMIEPIKPALTNSNIPDFSAKRHIKSSGIFPVVAFNIPPNLSPSFSERTFVHLLIEADTGIIERKDVKKHGIFRSSI